MKTMDNVEDYFFAETPGVPNNFLLPLLIYRGVQKDSGNLAVRLEQRFRENGWNPAWRSGIYDFAHYHSNAHEVIGVSRGRARVLFGHTDGISTWLETGDIVAIPAGVGHQCLEHTEDFQAVGAYPAGQEPDIIRAGASEAESARERIENIPLPAADPVFGEDGPLVELW